MYVSRSIKLILFSARAVRSDTAVEYLLETIEKAAWTDGRQRTIFLELLATAQLYKLKDISVARLRKNARFVDGLPRMLTYLHVTIG